MGAWGNAPVAYVSAASPCINCYRRQNLDCIGIPCPALTRYLSRSTTSKAAPLLCSTPFPPYSYNHPARARLLIARARQENKPLAGSKRSSNDRKIRELRRPRIAGIPVSLNHES